MDSTNSSGQVFFIKTFNFPFAAKTCGCTLIFTLIFHKCHHLWLTDDLRRGGGKKAEIKGEKETGK